MSASSSTSNASIPSIKFDDLHNKDKQAQQKPIMKEGLGPKNFLLKKMNGGQSFCSPTDTMVSPCTAKLVQSKQRHYTKGKPLSLSSSFQASNSPPPAQSTFKPRTVSPPSGLGQKENVVAAGQDEEMQVEDMAL